MPALPIKGTHVTFIVANSLSALLVDGAHPAVCLSFCQFTVHPARLPCQLSVHEVCRSCHFTVCCGISVGLPRCRPLLAPVCADAWVLQGDTCVPPRAQVEPRGYPTVRGAPRLQGRRGRAFVLLGRGGRFRHGSRLACEGYRPGTAAGDVLHDYGGP